MRASSVRSIAAVCAFACAFLIVACSASGPQSEHVSLPLGEERAVMLTLEPGSGEVTVTGGGSALLVGDLTYGSAPQKPEVTDAVATSSAGTIRLVAVRKPPAHLASDAKTGVSDGWSLVLGGGAPTDISGHLDGRADLDLVSVDARNVTLTSTRSTVLKLGGPHPSLAKVDVKASGGLRADLAGEYPALDSFTMDLANGGGEIDLSGPWHHPTTLAFAASGGNLQLTLPRSANVKIVREGTGTVEVPAGFRPAESGSSNAAYAYAPGQVTSDSLTIRLAMSGGSAKLLFAGK